jgi:hypothetical protein
MLNEKKPPPKTQQTIYNQPLTMIDLPSGICYATWD